MKKLFLVLLFALSFGAFAKEYKLPYAKTNVVFETEDDALATKITRDRGFIIYTEKEKIAKAHKNKKHNYYSRGNKGMHWYNNEIVQMQAFECPDGFVKGKLPK